MTKGQLRRFWFQAHKWIGLTLAILIIPISLTGSALVWDHGLERLLHPARYHANATASLAPGTYVAAARAHLSPDDRIGEISFAPHAPVEVHAVASKREHGFPVRTSLWLDPVDAHLIDRSASDRGLLRTIHMLHESLFVRGIGRQIVGVIGIALFVSAISGIWLWWPTVGSWLRGLRWRRRPRVEANLHHMAGFWVAIPLGMLAITGAWIAFPQLTSRIGAAAPRPGPHVPDRRALFRAQPLARPATPLAVAIATAEDVASGQVADIRWPTDLQPQWQVRTGDRTVLVDDADHAASLAPSEARHGHDGLFGVIHNLHSGHGMPFLWQLVIFVTGLVPTLLGITGIIMWWRARKTKEGRTAPRERPVGEANGAAV